MKESAVGHATVRSTTVSAVSAAPHFGGGAGFPSFLLPSPPPSGDAGIPEEWRGVRGDEEIRSRGSGSSGTDFGLGHPRPSDLRGYLGIPRARGPPTVLARFGADAGSAPSVQAEGGLKPVPGAFSRGFASGNEPSGKSSGYE